MFVSPTLPRDFDREFLALATRAIDRTFYKKRFFVMADTLARVMAVTANRFPMGKLFVARASHTLSHSTGLRPPRNSAGADFLLTGPTQRNEPCRRRAFVPCDCIVQFPHASPAAAYRHHSVQSESAFGIARLVRISHRTAELGRLDIR